MLRMDQGRRPAIIAIFLGISWGIGRCDQFDSRASEPTPEQKSHAENYLENGRWIWWSPHATLQFCLANNTGKYAWSLRRSISTHEGPLEIAITTADGKPIYNWRN